MSSANLRKNAKSTLKEFNRLADNIRKEVNSKNHILIMDPRNRELQHYVKQIFEDSGVEPPAKGQALAQQFIEFHRKYGRKTWVITPKKQVGVTVQIKASSFGSFKTWKTEVLPGFVWGDDFFKGSPEKREKLRKNITGKTGEAGLQLGHRDDSVVSTTAAEVITEKNTSSTDRLQIIQGLRKIKSSYGLEGMTAINVTKQGRLKRDAEFRMIYESVEDNQGKSHYEKALLTEMRKFLSDMALSKNSRSVPEATLDILEDSLRHGKVVRTGRERSKAREKRTSHTKVPVAMYALGTRATIRKKGSKAYSDFDVQAYMNAKVTNAVTERMKAPALVYRTGRFADSVKVSKVTTGAKAGIKTIQYTYMRSPYEVFEMGSGSDLATPERDPRTIIGGALRAVAQEMMLKRFRLMRT